MRLNETLGDFVHLPAMRAKHWDGEFAGWNYLGPTPKGCCKSFIDSNGILGRLHDSQNSGELSVTLLNSVLV